MTKRSRTGGVGTLGSGGAPGRAESASTGASLTSLDDTPRYRVQVVSEKTSVPGATLRAWERRYGVPAPARSDSQYRLYSNRDVGVVLEMARLLASGVRPAEAARLALRQGELGAGPRLPELCERLVSAAVGFDDAAIRDALDTAFAQGPATQVFDECLSPALTKVGALWEAGELTVAHEHLFAALVRDRLVERLERTLPSQANSRALLACIDEEQHDLGLFGFALHVASWGIRPVVLGSRVPPAALKATIRDAQPRFVALSIVTPLRPPRARTLFAEYSRALRGQVWVLGGPGAAAVAPYVEAAGGRVARSAKEAYAIVIDPGRPPARRRRP